MEIKPVAYFHSPIGGKFGIPRQPGLAPSLKGEIVLEPEIKSPDILRGLDEFDFIWLIWEFNLNKEGNGAASTVRPPRLGGNKRIGIFASRSPYRPNRLGLSSAKIESIDEASGIISVSGADLADGTPIYDIKPYVAYSDSHPDAKGGFTDTVDWKPLKVSFRADINRLLTDDELQALEEILSQDPRPQYHNDPERVYGMEFKGRNIRFTVNGEQLDVLAADYLESVDVM